MKRTQVTELFANIKKTFVSFFSIFMFAALGIGIFLGISWAGPALEHAADRMLDEGSFHHFEIQYPYGLTDDDLKKLSDVEGVTQVETAYQSFQTAQLGNANYTVKVQSLGQNIDTPLLVEGVLPEKADEMAFHAESAKELGVKVGDVITFAKDGGDGSSELSLAGEDANKDSANTSGMKYLTSDTFKVTAIVNSPAYLSKGAATYGFAPTASGVVNALAWVPESSFDTSAFQGGYPIVLVSCDGLSGIETFSDEYKKRSGEIEARITELGGELALARYDSLHGQAQAKIDDAEKQINDGKKQIADGEQELANGKAELETRKAEGQAKLNDAYQQLINGEAEYNAGLAEYSSYKGQYDSVVSTMEGYKSQVNSLVARKQQLDKDKEKIGPEEYNKRFDALVAEANGVLASARQYNKDIPEYEVTKEDWDLVMPLAAAALNSYRDIPFEMNGKTLTLNEAGQELDAAKSKLDAGRAELDYGWSQYYAGQAEYEALVAEGEQAIADGEKKIADAKSQVAENEPKLEDAKAMLEEMKKYSWTILPRSYNSGVGEVSTFSGVTNNLSISMAALFIIVGLLVSYFAVSRIVREQITQIGTKKALGFRQGEITVSYLLYSGIAVLAGAIVGALVGFLLVEGIIGGVLGGMFAFGAYPAYFGWGLFLIVTIVELALVLAATYLACRSILKEHAVELLKGSKPPSGKAHFYEKWGIWDKLPLLVQTIVNNCVNDKRRVLSTIVGVAGATALIVTAITLNNDVLKSYDRHYENVYGFNAIAYAESTPPQATANVEAVLKEQGATTAQVYMKNYMMEQPNDESGILRIVSPADDDAFEALYHVNPLAGGSVDLSAEGAWVSQAYADHFGVKAGDMLLVSGDDGTKHEVPILGFYEFWLTYHEAVIGRDYFEKEFGTFEPNVVLADTGSVAVSDTESALSEVEGFSLIIDDATYQYGNFETFSSVSSAVVAIYLALAALMAVVVLLNLNEMFIDEKKRELIVLMINGFSVKDAKHYISYDNIVLTAIGIIAGIVLGCVMGSVTVLAIEPSTATFIKAVDGWAVGIGIVGSAALALIMSMIALRRIPKFDLTDINKL